MDVGIKVVYLGDDGKKIAGTFRQFAGENEEEMVILLGAPQADGAKTIIVPSDKVEVIGVSTKLTDDAKPEAEAKPEAQPKSKATKKSSSRDKR